MGREMGREILLIVLLLGMVCAIESISVPLTHEPVYFKVLVYRPVNVTIVASDDEDLVMEIKEENRIVVIDDKKDYGRDVEHYALDRGHYMIKVYFAPESIEQVFGSFTITVPGHNIEYARHKAWKDDKYQTWNHDIEMPSDSAGGEVSFLDGIISIIAQIIDMFFSH